MNECRGRAVVAIDGVVLALWCDLCFALFTLRREERA